MFRACLNKLSLTIKQAFKFLNPPSGHPGPGAATHNRLSDLACEARSIRSVGIWPVSGPVAEEDATTMRPRMIGHQTWRWRVTAAPQSGKPETVLAHGIVRGSKHLARIRANLSKGQGDIVDVAKVYLREEQ